MYDTDKQSLFAMNMLLVTTATTARSASRSAGAERLQERVNDLPAGGDVRVN
ncbi:MAG: hypothetical protein JWR38_1081 [Mucilaginibacter sp.]|nr:hypothetical protein [Mucilaginibacter sp.]